MSPADKWKKYYAQHAPPKQIEEARHENFRYVLYPEKMKVVRNGGIEMHNRFYYAPILQQKIRNSVLVKYDPYDVSSIMVDLDGDGKYVKIPCYRNPFNRSSNYEMYRAQRQQKGDRDGTLTKDGTASIALAQSIENEEARLTAKSKKDKAREAAAVKDYKKHSKPTAVKPKESDANELIDQAEHLGTRSTTNRTVVHAAKTTRRSKNKKNSTSETARAHNSDLFVIRGDWHAASEINYDQAPMIY
jgi:putative transposase